MRIGIDWDGGGDRDRDNGDRIYRDKGIEFIGIMGDRG